MKFLGIEITRPQQHAAPKKVSSVEIGDSGTSFFQGIISEEYNTKLSGTQGIEVYDKMRKGDATVKAAVLATSLPIRRANWFIEAASEDAQDEEIKAFVEQALFDWMTITWNDLLRQALLCLPYGVMVFEKVFTTKEADSRTWIIWKKLAPRLPKSIYAWQTNSGKDGIQQMTTEGKLVDIPMERLLVFVNEKEGDNWWGTSILRSAYKHWRFKDGFYNIDAVAFERQGLGVPKAKMPDNYSDEDKERAATILKNLRAHEQQYIIEPHDIEVEFMDMKGKQVRDPKESIQHHNREIVKAVLAQFLELGATESGSRALSSDQSDLFLQSLEAVAGNIADVFNKYAIPQLVDLNFDNVKAYPELRYKGISRVDVEQLSNAYKTLTEAGGVHPTDSDEQHWREVLSLPERTEEDDDVTPAPGRAKQDEEDEEGDDIENELGMSLFDDLSKKKSFDDFTPENRDFRRPLTFAEEKVNFDAIRNTMDRLEGELSGEAKELFNQEADRYMKELSRAVNNNDLDAVKKATFRIRAAYTLILKQYFKLAFEFGKNNSSREMGKTSPPNPNQMMKQIDLAAATIAERHAGEFTTAPKLAVNEALEKGATAAAALAAADKKLRSLIDERVRQTAEITMAGYINNGRYTTFEAYMDDIYALQRSELLDSRTCNYCLSIDGRITEKEDGFARNTIFHTGCRGIWVEILQEEEQKPSIDGIPDSLRDRFGDSVNELVQPKTPSNKSNNTDAKKEIKKRRDRRIKRQKEE